MRSPGTVSVFYTVECTTGCDGVDGVLRPVRRIVVIVSRAVDNSSTNDRFGIFQFVEGMMVTTVRS